MAIDQIRQVAHAIKQCPQIVDHESPPNDQCFSAEVQAGPPVNVTWDVGESKTARVPYQGYVEFDLPASWLINPLQPTDRKVAKACERSFRTEAETAAIWAKTSVAAKLGLADNVEPPRSKVWHYRFEFDVGSDTPELMKILWIDGTGKAQAVTASHSCWTQAAQSAPSHGKDR